MSMERASILIVEDEIKIAQVLEEFLQQAGYQTHILHRGDEVVAWLGQQIPSLMLLDLMLPGKNGLEVCREVRQFSDLPIIITTAKVDEIDRLLGLELGADDYVCKPYSPREVVARVKAHLRRSELRAHPEASQLLSLDGDRLKVCHGDKCQDLTAVEFALLNSLYHSPGMIISRDRLMDRIYTDNRVVSDRTIDSHVKKIRRKLALLLPDREIVHSVYGVGYRYEE